MCARNAFKNFSQRQVPPRTLALIRAWGSFLAEFEWDWFATLTFRYNVNAQRAMWIYRSFLDDVEKAACRTMGWFAVPERGLLGRLHIHSLIVGANHLYKLDWEKNWQKRAGNAVLRDYIPGGGAAQYCAKRLGHDSVEHCFSDSLLRQVAHGKGLASPASDCSRFLEAKVYETRTDDKQAPPSIHIFRKSNPKTTCTTERPAEEVWVPWRDENVKQSTIKAKRNALSREDGRKDCAEQKHNEKADNGGREKNQEQEARISTVDPSARWTDPFGGTNVQSRKAFTSLAVEATKLDEQLKAQWAEVTAAIGTVNKASIRFGKLCEEIRAKQLHRFVPKPGSRKSFVSFAEYIFDRTNGEVSKGTVYVAIELYKLTQGPHALTEEDVARMPVHNACLLGRLKPGQRTPDIVEAAKKTSKREFPAKVQAKLNEYLPPEQQRMPRVDFFRKLHPTVATKLEETIERFTHLPVVRDGDRGLTLQEKAIYAICNAAEQFASEDLAAEEPYRPREVEVPEARSGEDRGYTGSTEVVLGCGER
jgi:hypothetical protein